ncbi:MAG TPA: 50S ribosomal protein L24 [Candidatus Izemoplasmatales bacterium]|nr:50S ribosomal protein L24 [Candidatus Izemoplasmatales bacterium]
MKLKKGDKVVIIAGQDKGKTGTINKILTKSDRVTLEGEGLTKVKKHLKPSQIAPDGGIMDVDKPIHISNVMILDPKEKKRTRIGFKEVTRKTKKDSETSMARYAKKSGEILE